MYKLFQNKRGFDKPIEIFVALFIILAVAMVILKMFSAQISQKREEIQRMSQSENIRQLKATAIQECKDLCTEAMEAGCTPAKIAQYCIHRIQKEGGGLDLNGNGVVNEYNTEIRGGIGVCEDRVYCFHLESCKCNVALDSSGCIKQLCTYYKDQTNSVPEANSMIQQFLSLGSCDKGTSTIKDWTQLTPPTCS